MADQTDVKTKTAFTPGPWEWDLFAAGWGLVGAYLANGSNVRPRVLISHSKPDGALIATAPELYDLLSELLRWPSVRACIGSEFEARANSILAKAAQPSGHDQRRGMMPDVEAALEVAMRYGGIDGGHHKAWIIDQMVRALTGDKYEEWVREHNDGPDGPDTYEWGEGIAP